MIGTFTADEKPQEGKPSSVISLDSARKVPTDPQTLSKLQEQHSANKTQLIESKTPEQEYLAAERLALSQEALDQALDQSGEQANMPAKDDLLPSQPASALSFSTIEAALRLAREIAQRDFTLHVQAMAKAQGLDERTKALKQLQDSLDATRLTDEAYQSLISAQGAFNDSSLKLIEGNQAGAQRFADEVNQHLGNVSTRLDMYHRFAQKSSMLDRAIAAGLRLDVAAGSAVNKLKSDFLDGIKGLSGRVKAMGALIRSQIHIAAQTCKERGEKALHSAQSMLARWAQSTKQSLSTLAQESKDSAQYTAKLALGTGLRVLQESAKVARSVQARAEQAAQNALLRAKEEHPSAFAHANTVASLASKAVQGIGGVVASAKQAYTAEFEASKDKVLREVWDKTNERFQNTPIEPHMAEPEQEFERPRAR